MFIASKRIFGNTVIEGIMLDFSGFKLRRKISKSIMIFGKHVTSKSIVCIVSELYCFFKSRKRYNRKEWTKYFFFPDFHIFAYISEQNCWNIAPIYTSWNRTFCKNTRSFLKSIFVLLKKCFFLMF